MAKHRSGRVDDVKMRFKSKYARFENWDGDTEKGSGTRVSRINTDSVEEAGSPFAAASTPLSGGTVDLTSTTTSDDAPPF